MYNVTVDITDAIQKMQARIIDLTSKKISLELEIKRIRNMIEMEDRSYTLNQLKRDEKILVGKVIDIEILLKVNKELLNQTDDHEYQLES